MRVGLDSRVMHPNCRGLAFLLSLGSLPIACNNKGDETDGTLSTDPTANTGTSTATGTDATDPTTTDATTTTDPSTTTTGPTGGMDTGTSEVAPTTTNSSVDTGDTELPPPSDPICIEYAAHLVECFPRYAQYQESYAQTCEVYKNYGLRVDGQPCADAFDALYVCLSKAKCGDIESGGVCEKQEAQIPEACPSLGEEMPETDSVGDTSGSSG